MALSSSANRWRSSRWLCHASPLFFFFSSHPFPSRALLSTPFCFSLPSPPRDSGAFRSSEIKKFRHASHFYTPLFAETGSFLHQVLVHAIHAGPFFETEFVVAFLWKSLGVSENFWKAKSVSQEREMFSAELCGQRARVHLADRFLSAALSVRLSVFEEEDLICGSMLWRWLNT